MTVDTLQEAKKVMARLRDYKEYRDKVTNILNYPNIPVHINCTDTPLDYDDTVSIQNFIIDLCNKSITRLEKEFEEL